MEKIKSITQLLKNYGLIILAVGIIETPIIWKIVNSIVQERIEILNSTITFLENRIDECSSIVDSMNKSSNASEVRSDTTDTIPKIESGKIFPKINNSKKLSKDEINNLAKFYKLFTPWKINPHLRFKAGDVSYWYEQNLTLEQLKMEFESRRIVLERAEKNGQIINTQGDLSYHAEQIQSEILRARKTK